MLHHLGGSGGWDGLKDFLRSNDEEKYKLEEKMNEFEFFLTWLTQHTLFHDTLVKKVLQLQSKNKELMNTLVKIKGMLLPEIQNLKRDLVLIRDSYLSFPIPRNYDLWKELVGILSETQMKSVNDLWRKNNYLTMSVENLTERCKICVNEKVAAEKYAKELSKRNKELSSRLTEVEGENRRIQVQYTEIKRSETQLRIENEKFKISKSENITIFNSLQNSNQRNSSNLQISEANRLTLESTCREQTELLGMLSREKLTLVRNIKQLEDERDRLEGKISDQRKSIIELSERSKFIRSKQKDVVRNCLNMVCRKIETTRISWRNGLEKVKNSMIKESRRRDGVEQSLKADIRFLEVSNLRLKRDSLALRKELRDSMNQYDGLERKYLECRNY